MKQRNSNRKIRTAIKAMVDIRRDMNVPEYIESVAEDIRKKTGAYPKDLTFWAGRYPLKKALRIMRGRTRRGASQE